MKLKHFLWILLLLVFPSISFSAQPLPKDIQGNPIQAVSSVRYVMNVSITTSSYVAVSNPVEVPFKSVYVKTRAGNSWRLATSSSPTAYILMDSGFSLALVKTASSVLFYARADTSDDTLEILFMD